MRRSLTVLYELARRNGAEANAGRYLRRWLREAGFFETLVTTTISCTDPVGTREWGDNYAERTLQSNLADKTREYGIATRSELEEIANA